MMSAALFSVFAEDLGFRGIIKPLKKPQQEGLSTVGDARAVFCHFGYMARPPNYPYGR